MCFARRLPLLLVALLALNGTSFGQEVKWRYDYAKARKEAEDRGLPLLVDFGTENCYWCRKLDEITFRDATIASILNERFIPLKLDAGQEPKLTQMLRISAFPTLVFAGPDGRILDTIEGFQDAAKFQGTIQRQLAALPQPAPKALAVTPTPAPSAQPNDDRRARRAQDLLNQAREFYKNGEYLLCLDRTEIILSTYGDLPEKLEAQAMMTKIKTDPDWMLGAVENLADRLGLVYLNLGEALANRGQATQAIQYYERIVRLFPGTRHAESAQIRLQHLRAATSDPKAQ